MLRLVVRPRDVGKDRVLASAFIGEGVHPLHQRLGGTCGVNGGRVGGGLAVVHEHQIEQVLIFQHLVHLQSEDAAVRLEHALRDGDPVPQRRVALEAGGAHHVQGEDLHDAARIQPSGRLGGQKRGPGRQFRDDDGGRDQFDGLRRPGTGGQDPAQQRQRAQHGQTFFDYFRPNHIILRSRMV